MEICNRRYLGNKTKLLPFIKDTIEKECRDFTSIFDAFAGTGSVASAFIDKKKLKRSEIEELAKMIEAYKGE